MDSQGPALPIRTPGTRTLGALNLLGARDLIAVAARAHAVPPAHLQ